MSNLLERDADYMEKHKRLTPSAAGYVIALILLGWSVLEI